MACHFSDNTCESLIFFCIIALRKTLWKWPKQVKTFLTLVFGSANCCAFCWHAWPSLSLLSMFWKSVVRLGQLHKAAQSMICGEASVGGCCTLKIMFTVKLKCGGSVMKRIEVKRTIQNSDFHVALQRKLIFFKVTCCLSLRLLRKLHLKLFSTEKKEKGTITVICGAVWARWEK